MQTPFPALTLFLALCAVLVLGLPLLLWLLMRKHLDAGDRLWFAGVAFQALAMVLVASMARFSAVAAVLFVGAVGMAIESMRWALGRPATNLRWAGAILAVYAAFQIGLEAAGLRMSVGYIVNLSLLVAADLWLIALLHQVARQQQSRGLPVVMAGIVLVVLPNLYRLLQALAVGQGVDIAAGTPATNVSILVVTLLAVLHVIGYGGFMFEKLHNRHLAIEREKTLVAERQRLAEAHAQALESVVRQRDEMILLNSRFSVIQSMALYNTTIVHEISQPLQALMSMLDGLALQAEKQQSDPSHAAQKAMQLVEKMSRTLATLRGLVSGHRPATEAVRMEAVLDEILPIVQTQALRQNVRLMRTDVRPSDDSNWVLVNHVLLQRVMFNLLTNALEALAQTPGRAEGGGHIALETHHTTVDGKPCCVLRIQDNGPGFPPDLALRTGLALNTTKPQGSGIGLSFTRLMLESWQGSLHVSNVPQAEGGGARVDICLPTHTAPWMG